MTRPTSTAEKVNKLLDYIQEIAEQRLDQGYPPADLVEQGNGFWWPNSGDELPLGSPLDNFDWHLEDFLKLDYELTGSAETCSVCLTVTGTIAYIQVASFTICRIREDCVPPEPENSEQMCINIDNFNQDDVTSTDPRGGQPLPCPSFENKPPEPGNYGEPGVNYSYITYRKLRIISMGVVNGTPYNFSRAGGGVMRTGNITGPLIIPLQQKRTEERPIGGSGTSGKYLMEEKRQGEFFYSAFSSQCSGGFGLTWEGAITSEYNRKDFYFSSEEIWTEFTALPLPPLTDDDDNNGGTSPPIPTPSPQPTPMECCDLEPILKAIAKQNKILKRIETVIAPEEFYKVNGDGTLGTNIALIPKRFIYPLATGNEPVTNIPKMMEYMMRHIDRSLGAPSWEVVIKDTDPNTPGDQSLPIQVHSTNDALKAILQFLIDRSIDKKAPAKLAYETGLHNQRALIHLAYELASTKKMVVHNNHFLQNIEDYLDYKVDQKTITVPFAINPMMNNVYSSGWNNSAVIQQLFKHQNVHMVVTDNVEKVALGETLHQIGRNAAIAASPHVYQYKEGIVGKLVDAAQLGAELTNTALLIDIKRAMGVMTKDEMKNWEKDAEKGYIPSRGNTENPEVPTAGRPQKYYGQSKPPRITNTTKRSRRRNRRG